MRRAERDAGGAGQRREEGSLAEAVQKLPPKESEAVALYYDQELSVREAAEI